MANRTATPVRARNELAGEKAQLMSASEIDRTLVRLAHEILERNNGIENLMLVGVERRGAPLAARLAQTIRGIESAEPPVETIDTTAYRDDRPQAAAPRAEESSPPRFSADGKKVILVDDVLFTGRTTRAALDALLAFGRPQRVELCVLIDRGHRELPILANYVGRSLQTSETEVIEVRLREVDGEDRVVLCEKQA
ncbi:MAG TPA: bifunctional pyr operon transcriptional regulator/uracil phosphoribosyltransferase PyrR [Terriglobia bacterium]|nr:bifunctional pyr operon transcriptional regulator/uracil phosphoribosyltransferase PyrR [Terriglobia bacterium]